MMCFYSYQFENELRKLQIQQKLEEDKKLKKCIENQPEDFLPHQPQQFSKLYKFVSGLFTNWRNSEGKSLLRA